MKYFSTRGGIEPVDFQAAVMMVAELGSDLILQDAGGARA